MNGAIPLRSYHQRTGIYPVLSLCPRIGTPGLDTPTPTTPGPIGLCGWG